MRLCILRHSKAVSPKEWEGDDTLRPLTRGGVDTAHRVLAHVRPLLTASEILTSPWIRARQTAEIASDIWKLPLSEAPWLAGGAMTPSGCMSYIAAHADAVLVGHEPDLSELIQFLSGAQIQMKKCGLVMLKGSAEKNGMHIVSIVSPKIVDTLVQ